MATNNEYLELFNYEVQNRAMAYGWCQAMVKRDFDPDTLKWYEAYLAFEELSQRLYAPHAAKHGIDIRPNLTTKLTVLFIKIAYSLVSEQMILQKAYKDTVPYVDKLKRLRDIAPEDEEAFFDYVIEQEQAQVETLRLKLDGRPLQAAEVLNCFVAQHTEAPA